jgi:hypothetical protein
MVLAVTLFAVGHGRSGPAFLYGDGVISAPEAVTGAPVLPVPAPKVPTPTVPTLPVPTPTGPTTTAPTVTVPTAPPGPITPTVPGAASASTLPKVPSDTGAPTATGTGTTDSDGATPADQAGAALFATIPASVATRVASFGAARSVHGAFEAVVNGALIREVVFTLDGRVIATDGQAPFDALIAAVAGVHTLAAQVSFTDATPAAAISMRFREHAPGKRRGPGTPVTPALQTPASPPGHGGVN